MKRAAITGILGQDGTYLARRLARQDYQVHGLIRQPFERVETRIRGRFTADELLAIRFHTGGLEDPYSLFRFLKAAQPDELYHLAGVSDSRQSHLVPEQTLCSIGIGTLRLLEAAREVNPDLRILLASSSEVFGQPRVTPQDEATPCQPVTPYGIAKVAADSLARLHRQRYGQFVSVAILYNHESPLRPANYLSRRVARAVAEIKRGRSGELQLADLTAERDWSDARDFVRGFWLALQAKAPEDFILASGTSRCVAELVDCAFRCAGLDYREYVTVPAPSGASPAQTVSTGLCGNASKAETLLKWKREWTFRETIEDIVQAELEERPEAVRADPDPRRR